MKKWLLIADIILIICFFCSCSGKFPSDNKSLISGEPAKTNIEDESEMPKKNIALVLKTLTNPFFIDMESGAKKAADELGVNLIVKAGAQETFYEQQINIVEDLIKMKVDAIVISPVDSIKLIPVLKKARENGIFIVCVDEHLDRAAQKKLGMAEVPYVTVDNENGAYLSAKYISDKINSSARAAIIEGIRGVRNSENRKNGALKAFYENRNITVSAVEKANWRIEDAYTRTSEIFNKYPDVKLLFCANDLMALGAIEYLSENNIDGVLVAGFDCIKEAREAIDNGKLLVTINQKADLQGNTAIRLAFKMLQNEEVPLETLVPVEVVTKEQNLW